MKTLEYPLQEMISFEMDENKTWFVRYNREHEYFPPLYRKRKTPDIVNGIFTDEVPNKKGYRDFCLQTFYYCEENSFLIEGWGIGMIDIFNSDKNFFKSSLLAFSLKLDFL